MQHPDLSIPDFLRRQPQPQEPAMTDQKPEPTTADLLQQEASNLHREIDDLDKRMATLSDERVQKRKELRGITSRIVTLKLKTSITS